MGATGFECRFRRFRFYFRVQNVVKILEAIPNTNCKRLCRFHILVCMEQYPYYLYRATKGSFSRRPIIAYFPLCFHLFLPTRPDTRQIRCDYRVLLAIAIFLRLYKHDTDRRTDWWTVGRTDTSFYIYMQAASKTFLLFSRLKRSDINTVLRYVIA